MLIDPKGTTVVPIHAGGARLFKSACVERYGQEFVDALISTGTAGSGEAAYSFYTTDQRFASEDDFNEWAKDNGLRFSSSKRKDAYQLYKVLQSTSEIEVAVLTPITADFTISRESSEGTGFGSSANYRGFRTDHVGLDMNDDPNTFWNMMRTFGGVAEEIAKLMFDDNAYIGVQTENGAGVWFEDQARVNDPDIDLVEGILFIDGRSEIELEKQQDAVNELIKSVNLDR